MKKGFKTLLIAVGTIILLVILFLLFSFVRHQFCLNREMAYCTPPGEMVEVDGHHMSVYVEGEGPHTLVFLAGGGTSSPILDFRSLYSLLSGEYRIAVVEKFGYGFSDVADSPRDIDTILRQTRTALQKAGVEGPYVLCPHSMSGIEALYWAQQYPQEVTAIIGLDMAVPDYYDVMEFSIPMLKLSRIAAELGVTRWMTGVAESDAILHGTLTEEEKNIYRAVFYNRTATAPMIREAESIRENAAIVEAGGVPDVPMLLFVSDGSGGTGFDTATWRSIPQAYIQNAPNALILELDCPHYVHDYLYNNISQVIRSYLTTL